MFKQVMLSNDVDVASLHHSFVRGHQTCTVPSSGERQVPKSSTPGAPPPPALPHGPAGEPPPRPRFSRGCSPGRPHRLAGGGEVLGPKSEPLAGFSGLTGAWIYSSLLVKKERAPLAKSCSREGAACGAEREGKTAAPRACWPPTPGTSRGSSPGHKGPPLLLAAPSRGSGPFATRSLAVWAAVGGTIQGRREGGSEDPEVLCPGPEAAFLHFRSTQEIAQNPAAFNSQGVKGRLKALPQLPYL